MIRVIDYKAGNAPSVLHAASHLGYRADYARGSSDIADATHIILPGVGSAGATMNSLGNMGLISAITDAVLNKKVFFLGVCVGMQILFEHSEEENTDCLGWLKGRVIKFDKSKVRVPQMGWNLVKSVKNPLPAFNDYFYFVNSFYARPGDESDIWAESDYNGLFTAAVCKGNIFATQFHIEKSGEAGLALLESFLRLRKRDNPC